MESSIKPGKVGSLAHVIDYDSQKIVKKEIFNNENGGVLMLALTQNMTIPQHAAPADVMIQSVEGKVEFTLDTTEHVLHTGDFIIMPKGTLHSVKAITDVKVMLTMLKA